MAISNAHYVSMVSLYLSPIPVPNMLGLCDGRATGHKRERQREHIPPCVAYHWTTACNLISGLLISRDHMYHHIPTYISMADYIQQLRKIGTIII